MKADRTSSNENEIELCGTVVEKTFAAGSKSEHTAIFLQTDAGDYQLRRLGGNPFSDPELKKLVGEKVVATGLATQALFVANKLKKTP